MKNLLIGLILVLPNLAFADYEWDNKILLKCKEVANYSVGGFNARGVEDFRPLESGQIMADKIGGSRVDKELLTQAIVYGYLTAKSKEDAYTTSMARCLDGKNF